MSMMRQIWLIVVLTACLAFLSSVGVNIFSARQYLETQLMIKNNDNAAALALSLSQQRGDPALLELLVSAQFDTGYYERITFTAVNGQTVVDKRGVVTDIAAPSWLMTWFPIVSRPGVAQVSDGWKALGKIEVVSHSAYAYQHLWESTYRAALWLAVVIGLLGAFATFLLEKIKRPLLQTVAQAQAICERQFITVPEPTVPELRQLTQAMNSMAIRLHEIFTQQSTQIEALRLEASMDRLTGVYHRQYFLNQMATLLYVDEQSTYLQMVRQGVFGLIRIHDLIGANKLHGHPKVDAGIQALGRLLKQHAESLAPAFCGRLNGSDFAICIACDGDFDETNVNRIVQELWGKIVELVQAGPFECYLGACTFNSHSSISSILSDADLNLARQESGAQSIPYLTMRTAPRPQDAWGEQGWHTRLTEVLQADQVAQRLQLIAFPVCNQQHQLVHNECPVRLQFSEMPTATPAAEFIPMLIRLQLTARLDEQVLMLALRKISETQQDIAINMAVASLFEPEFALRLRGLLAHNPESAKKLWIEFPEAAVFSSNLNTLRTLIRTLSGSGVRIGIEHMGMQMSKIQKLHEIGIDYIKVDAAYIQGIHQTPTMASFIQNAISIAHGLNLQVYAEGVNNTQDLEYLQTTAIDGWTGPAVVINKSS